MANTEVKGVSFDMSSIKDGVTIRTSNRLEIMLAGHCVVNRSVCPDISDVVCVHCAEDRWLLTVYDATQGQHHTHTYMYLLGCDNYIEMHFFVPVPVFPIPKPAGCIVREADGVCAWTTDIDYQAFNGLTTSTESVFGCVDNFIFHFNGTDASVYDNTTGQVCMQQTMRAETTSTLGHNSCLFFAHGGDVHTFDPRCNRPTLCARAFNNNEVIDVVHAWDTFLIVGNAETVSVVDTRTGKTPIVVDFISDDHPLRYDTTRKIIYTFDAEKKMVTMQDPFVFCPDTP